MKVQATALLEVEISERELANALFRVACSELGEIDDAGCDWCTDNNGNTFIAFDPEWKVSSNPKVAALIDAVHILRGYKLEDFKMETAKPKPY
jgi:hypothetical protein